jgi:hypothetical protein
VEIWQDVGIAVRRRWTANCGCNQIILAVAWGVRKSKILRGWMVERGSLLGWDEKAQEFQSTLPVEQSPAGCGRKKEKINTWRK